MIANVVWFSNPPSAHSLAEQLGSPKQASYTERRIAIHRILPAHVWDGCGWMP